jgi:tetratricopeptide (TPR) repeat protein
MDNSGPLTPGPAVAPALPPATRPNRLSVFLAATLVVLAVGAAYRNSFHGPCIFDDPQSIAGNPTIRHLWPIGPVLSPPTDGTVAGRPLVNLTLALNYALGGLDVRGYHAVNLALHLLAALTLLGVVRRTLQSPRLHDRYGAAALPLAAAVTLIWALHPLQTESVTYLVQRAEALAGLFYLLTLYAVIRADADPRPRRWHLLAVVCCLLGVASKEVIVTAPLVVLLYDRTFLAGTFRAAWRRRQRVYLALASTWLLVAYLLVRNGGRGGTAGFATATSPWRYALTQTWAITHYLQLTFWPSPLILDYGTWLAPGLGAVWPAALLLALLLAATALAVWRRPELGFPGVWFFACLAPTSSIVPVATQTIAEHRMYLALAAPVTLTVVGLWALCCRAGKSINRTGLLLGVVPYSPGKTAKWKIIRPVLLNGLPGLALLGLATALALTTARRNDDYRSESAIWQDTLAKRPDNPRAYQNLALIRADQGRTQEALTLYRQALGLDSRYPEAHNNLGNLLAALGHKTQAVEQYRLALRARPGYAEAHNNLGILLADRGQWRQALEQYELALEAKPDFPEACNDLANALANLDRRPDAVRFYEQALILDPGYVEAHNNLANLLAAMGRMPEAVAHYRQAVRLSPRRPDLRCNLAWLLATHDPAGAGDGAEAVALADSACALSGRAEPKPLAVLAAAYASSGRFPDAVNTARQALQLAQGRGQNDMAQAIAGQLAGYRDGRPFRQP